MTADTSPRRLPMLGDEVKPDRGTPAMAALTFWQAHLQQITAFPQSATSRQDTRELRLVVAVDGRLCEANPSAIDRLGYPLTTLTTLSWLQLLQVDSRQAGYDSWQRVQKGQSSEAVRLTLVAQDGTTLPVQGYAYRDDQAETVRVNYHLVSVPPPPDLACPSTPSAPAAPTALTPGTATAAWAAIADQTELITRALPDTTLIAVNDAYCRVLGQSQADLVGQPFLQLIPPSERAQVQAALRSLTPDQPVAYTEHLLALANGEMAYFQWSNRGQFDAQGRLYEIQSVGRNIQPYKQIQQRLQESEDAFRRLFDAAAIGLAQTTIGEGRYLRVNRKLCDILGYSEAELLSLTYKEISHPDDLPACAAYMQNLLAGKVHSHPVQKRFFRKDGAIVWCKTTVSFLHDINGKPIYAIVALEDITDQKAIEQALQASQTTLNQQTQILRAVLDSMSEGVIVLDASGQVRLSNATARQLLQLLPTGNRLGELPTWGPHHTPCFYQTDRQTPCPPDEFPLQRAMRGEVVDNQEVYILPPDAPCDPSGKSAPGTWLSFTAHPLTPATGQIQGSVIIFRDITRYKQVETEILHALAQEKALGEMRSRFLRLTSHEFRNPLTTILSTAELLQRYEWSREEQLAELALIQSKAQHLAALLEETLMLDQAETGQLQLWLEPLDLRVLSEQVIRSLQREYGLPTPITLVGDPAFPSVIWADKKLLQQILTNLIGNALKYSPQGNPIQVTYGRQGDQVWLQVTDHGLGIPPEDQAHLFEFCYRGKNVGSIPGTGLGLAIVQKCVTLHGGTIALTSEVGLGTTVIVKFPLRLLE